MTMLGLVLLIAVILELIARELRLVADQRVEKRPFFTAPEIVTLVGATLLLGPKAIELLT